MKVLQITAFSGWGCTGRIAVGIHEALRKENHESAIAWGRTNTAADSVKTIQIGSALDQNLHGLYTRLTDKCGFGSKKVTKQFLQEIENYAPDLIQLHILHGYYINLEVLFTYIKEKNIPVVWTFHDCWAFTGHCPYFDLVKCDKWRTGCNNCQQKKHHPTSMLLDNSKWNWEKKKSLYAEYANMTVVTPSKWLKDLVKESFLKDRNVEVINNGINLHNFKKTNGNFRKKYEIGNRKLVIGVSSTWVKSKGLDDFIRLSELLSEDYVIALIGLTTEQIKKLPEKIIGIERTDSVHELADIYTAADVFVNPTYEDNYPTTNLEAMACGTPVITYKTGGSVEIVQRTGAGIIVEQADVTALKEAINEVCNDNMIYKKRAEELNITILDENYRFQEYVSLYEKIVGEKE